jgi:hypothetical protein
MAETLCGSGALCAIPAPKGTRPKSRIRCTMRETRPSRASPFEVGFASRFSASLAAHMGQN